MKQGKIKLNVTSLLESLGKSLYREPAVALRELIQNGHDAVSFHRRTLDEAGNKVYIPEIRISYRKSKNLLILSDNGIGMSNIELEEEFSKVGGSSKVNEDTIQEIINNRGNLETRIIGQYGIGFLSAFLIADKVEVISKRENSSAYKWYCEGGEEYFLEEINTEFERGTKVILHLKQEGLSNNFSSIDEIKKLAIKYGYLLPVPIYVENYHVNPFAADWSSSRKFESMNDSVVLKFLRERFPIEVIDAFTKNFTAEHIRHGKLSYRACFFAGEENNLQGFMRGTPFENASSGIDVFVKGMFICRSNELLPQWADFINGVIDFDNLNVSLSREEIVYDELLSQYRLKIEKDIAERVSELKGTIKLKRIVDFHKDSLISGVALFGERKQDSKFRELFNMLIEIIPFETTHGTKYIEEYLRDIENASERFTKCESNTIYCMSKKTTGTGESLLAEELGWPVMFAIPMIEKILGDYVEMRSDALVLKMMKPDDFFVAKNEGADFNSKVKDIEGLFRLQLNKLLPKNALENIEVKVKSFRDSIPALLLIEPSDDLDGRRYFKKIEDAMGKANEEGHKEMLSFFQMMADNFKKSKSKRYFYINSSNENIKKLVKVFNMSPTDTSLSLSCAAIYNSALLQSSQYSLSPDQGQIIVENFNQTLGELLKLTIESIEYNLPDTDYDFEAINAENFVFCIHPFKHGSALSAIEVAKGILKEKFKIEAISGNEEVRDLKVPENIKNMISKCRFAIADISENNPNVMIEIGMLEMLGKPVVKIKDKQSDHELPVDLAGTNYCEYSSAKHNEEGYFIGPDFSVSLSKYLKKAIDQTKGLIK